MSSDAAPPKTEVNGPGKERERPLTSHSSFSLTHQIERENEIGEGEAIPQPWIVDGVDLLPGRSAIQRQVAERIPLQETIRSWDAIADGYVRDFRFKEDTANVVLEMPLVISLLNGNINGKRILDVGAGPGWFEDILFSLGDPAEVVALEPSERMTTHMEAHFETQAYRNKVKIVSRPIENSGLIEQFDIVVALNVLDVTSNLRLGLAEINRLLPVAGQLVGMIRHPQRNRLMALKGTGSYFPGYNSFYYEHWPGAAGEREDGLPNGIWARYMETEDWNNELRAAGFWSYLHVPGASSAVRERYPDIWKIYSRRPGALIISAEKIAEVS